MHTRGCPAFPIWLTTFLVLALTATSLSAQFKYGDIVYCRENTSIHNSGRLFGLTPGGKTHTIAQTEFPAFAVMPNPTNRGLWVAGIRWYAFGPANDGIILDVATDGSVTSLLFTRGLFPTSLSMNDDGNVIITDRMSGAVVQFDPLHSTVTTLYPRWYSSSGAEIDLTTGDLVVATSVGLHRLTLTGPRSITTLSLHATPAGHYGFQTDPATGEMLMAERGNVMALRLTTPPSMRTIVAGYPYGLFGTVQRDPANGKFLTSTWTTAMSRVFRIDTRTKTMTQLTSCTDRCMAVTSAGSRHLATGTAPIRGRQLPMLISFPRRPGATYAVALSFDHKPGVPIGNGHVVPLAPDALFQLSLTPNPLFSGFQGTLDTRGEGRAVLHVPNLSGLAGQRIFAAAVAVASGKVVGISNPIGFTVR